MAESREDKVRALFGDSQKQWNQDVPSVSQVVSGTGNIVAGGNVTIHHRAVVVKTQVIPGAMHISQETARTLTELVNQIVVAEAAVRKSPRNHAAVWGALKRKFKYSSLSLMPAIHGEEAISALRQDLGRLLGSKSAPKRVPDWRNKRYTAIHARVKQLGIEHWKTQHLQERYSVSSLKDLSDDDLDAVYQAVFARKKAP